MKGPALLLVLLLAVTSCAPLAAAVSAPAGAATTAPLPAGGEALRGVAEGLRGLATKENLPSGLRVILVFTVLSLAPAVLVMVTSFTRIVIVLHFIRKALGLNEIPPNSVVTGLAVFLTFFTMAGVFDEIHRQAVKPVTEGKLAWEQALDAGVKPLRRFMLAQTRQSDLKLFARLSRIRRPRSAREIPLGVLVPAFVLSEMKTAFQIGIVIFLPFLLVDLVVASTLMSSGLSGLSPSAVALPFKLLLFVLIDGWGLLVGSLMKSFR